MTVQESQALSDLENVIGPVYRVRLIGSAEEWVIDDGTFEGIFTDGGLIGVTFLWCGRRYTLPFSQVILEGR